MKGLPVVLAFVAGLGMGFALARLSADEEARAAAFEPVADAATLEVEKAAPPAPPTFGSRPEPPTATPAGPGANPVAAAPPQPAATPSAAGDGGPHSRARPPAWNDPNGPYMPSPAYAQDPDSPAQPLDVGDALRSTVDRKSEPGFENQIGDAHRALEREIRDDSWAYPLEADIQNSLTADTASGRFKAHYVECRATLCEIRLSATGDQAGALAAWADNVHKQPWAQRAPMTLSSSISQNGNVDRLIIVRRAKK